MAKQWGNKIWVETDAQEIVNMLEKVSHGPADSRHTIVAIRIQPKTTTVKISHIHRDRNKIADFLAKQGSMQETSHFLDQNSAPSLVKTFAHLDRLGLPSFRNYGVGSGIR